ncbi:MAG: alpha/beta hydrolase [Solirubrobacteraceae bacterium]|nr:alpha/beta hydrolase [Patulibacter sp.]
MTIVPPTPLTTLSTVPAWHGPVEQGAIDVAGAAIRWWAIGEGGPPVVLLHGGGAHSGWWHPVVERLAATRRVIGMDLSGHGDSGRRPTYSALTWADEILAVIDGVAGGHAIVVAHSMGGRPSSIAASRYPGKFSALVLVDTVVPTSPDEVFPRAGALREYPTVEAIVARFRIMPGQTEIDPDLLRTLGRQSATARGDAYVWKFDPNVFHASDGEIVNAHLPGITSPLVVIQGSDSVVVDPSTAAALQDAVGRTVPLLIVPGADHHVMLDRPRETADLLAWLITSGALGTVA